ncbi:MAG: pectate lyase [Planctomycetota bacterium]
MFTQRMKPSLGRSVTPFVIAGFCALAVSVVSTPVWGAAVVSNIVTSQRTDGSRLVDIYYDLSGGEEPMTVQLVLSDNNGQSWDIVPSSVALSGDIGQLVTNGKKKHIVWDAGWEWPGVRWEQISVKIIATEDSADGTVMLTLPGDVKLKMVRIPRGIFLMGSPDSERSRTEDEGPAHEVNINYDFYMGKYEVTQAQWKSVMDNNPARRYGVGDNFPVSHVSWDACQQFVSALNRLDIGNFRLPSEAEWEYACRAGTQTRFYFGDALEEDDACGDREAQGLGGDRLDYMWYCGNNSPEGAPDFGAKPVGQKLPNAFGLYDMHGNIWEWCLDEYHSNYDGAPINGSAWQTKWGTPRVLRGGGWDYHAKKCRSAVRCGYSAARGYTFHGLRVVWFPYARKSDKWFASWEAEMIGDNILSYQSDIGAWPKNMNMEAHGYQGEKFTKNWGTTIDNSATYTQMDFLTCLYHTTKKERFKDSFIRGLDWLLEAQYENGGWPQRYPRAGDYGDYITFNDDAMVGVMRLMRNILEEREFAWVEANHRKRVKKAYENGLQCILDCQVVVDGRRAVWGQQHDPRTLQPRPAREYEPPALCSRESVGIVLFLMSIEDPSPQIVEAVEAAVRWFERNKITGVRIVSTNDGRSVIKDPDAPALWARFYDIKSGRPIFSGRDGVIKYRLEEIEKERASGYQWYARSGDKVLREYAKWKKKIQR